MQPAQIRRLLKAEPFAPIRLALSDGRTVLIHHPGQAVATERQVFIGLATVVTTRRHALASPKSGDAIARDWIMVNLLQVTMVEPDDGNSRKSARKRQETP